MWQWSTSGGAGCRTPSTRVGYGWKSVLVGAVFVSSLGLGNGDGQLKLGQVGIGWKSTWAATSPSTASPAIPTGGPAGLCPRRPGCARSVSRLRARCFLSRGHFPITDPSFQQNYQNPRENGWRLKGDWKKKECLFEQPGLVLPAHRQFLPMSRAPRTSATHRCSKLASGLSDPGTLPPSH